MVMACRCVLPRTCANIRIAGLDVAFETFEGKRALCRRGKWLRKDVGAAVEGWLNFLRFEGVNTRQSGHVVLSLTLMHTG